LKEGNPADPFKLFDQFSDAMSEDFMKERKDLYPNAPEEQLAELSYNDLLLELRSTFQYSGRENSFYQIPEPDLSLSNAVIVEEHIDVEKAGEYHDANLPLLNKEQRAVYDAIKNHIDEQTGGVYSLDAPGGCGKTFTCNLILSYVRMNGDSALALAMTGIASLLLDHGMTFHRGTGCPIPCREDSSSKYPLESSEADRLRKAKFIVVDEVSMMTEHQFNMMDRFLRELMSCNEIMGGKVVLLMHDWRQQLPILPHGNRADIVAACIFNSPLWTSVRKLKLNQNMRVQRLIDERAEPDRIKQLQDHAKWLLDLGDGTLETISTTNLVNVPKEQVCGVNSNLVTRSSPVPLCTPCQFLTTEYYPLLHVNNFELLTY
jgi:hypothetical protein